MACLRQLLSGILTLIFIMVYSVAEDVLEPTDVTIPLYYDIQLRLRIEENIFFSKCDINIEIINKTNQINMFSENLGILKVTLLNQFNQNKPEEFIEVTRRVYDSEKKIIALYFRETLSPGYYTLNLRYCGFISIKGGFKQLNYVAKKQGTILVSETHFQPLLIRRIFPCWSSSDKSNFTISIEHSNKYSALSTMPIKSVNEHKHDMKWTHFEITPRMSPYHISIILTDFGIPFGVDWDAETFIWCRKETAYLMEFARMITKNITLYLKREWDSLKSFPKLNYIIIPGLEEQNGIVVNLRIIIYNEADIIYDKRTHSVTQKFNIMNLIGYEIIQKWLKEFEIINNPFYWALPWLRKGFPIFFATHVLNQSLPNTRIIDLFVVQVQHESLKLDVDERMLPIDQTETVPAEIVNHVKGPVILRMLQHAFNIEKFWKGVRTYFEEEMYGFYQFWASLKFAMDKIDKEVFGKHFMNPWGSQEGYLVLTVIRNYDAFADTLNISVENVNILKDNRPIPVSFATRRNLNFNQTEPQIWIEPPLNLSGHFYILPLNYTEESWVIFNIQQTGYYRVNYDDENWARISVYLNSRDYWRIHVLNRAQIIDDAFHFMLLGKLRSAVFWQLTKYLERERDYIAWYPMFKAMEYISSTFQNHFAVHFMQEKLSNLLNKLLQKITYEEKPKDDDFTRALRQEAIQWVCKMKMSTVHSKCSKMANIKLNQHLQINTNLSPWWKKWVYCYGLAAADNTTWQQMINKIRENNDKIVYLITCPNHLVRIHDYILTTYKNEQDIYNDKRTITHSSVVQTELRHFVYTIMNYLNGYLHEVDYLLENFESIKPR